MKTKRSLNLLTDCRMALESLYSQARSFGMESREMDKRKNEILARANKAPQWVRAYLKGFFEGYTKANQHSDIVYGRFIEGKFYTVNRDRADYYEKHGIEPRAFAESEDNGTLGLYWARYNGERPFFVARNFLAGKLS
jgi:hypothetical protein